ncbi:MAG TPA: deoxyribose-phosphate aldolase [Thermoleophilia bacterium]|nr:deoxyribose-phosphate aldolase [Thermoleophilia bacterium]
MLLTTSAVARMIDLSCVRTVSNKADIEAMAKAALKYGFGQVSVLQSFIPYTRELLHGHPEVHVVGNVSFPSGSDSTSLKVAQAREMIAAGCDELDLVMNIGALRSGDLAGVERDLRAVIDTVRPTPVKVIIEIMVLTPEETEQACAICLRAGAAFVKTGTGWGPRGTTPEDVRLIKSMVGDRIRIKASGGIRDLDTLARLYQAGATRFGVNLQSGVDIVDECLALGRGVEV